MHVSPHFFLLLVGTGTGKVLKAVLCRQNVHLVFVLELHMLSSQHLYFYIKYLHRTTFLGCE